MTGKGKPRRSRLRRALVTTGVLITLLAVATAILRIRFHGAALAETVTDMLNDRIRGRVETSSVEWPLTSAHKLVTGGWIPVTIRDLEVYDEFGDLVIAADVVHAELDAHPAIFGRHDLVIRNIVFPGQSYALIKQVREPYPAHQYDEFVVSIISAFYSKRAPSFRAGVSGHASQVFDLQDYWIEDATLDFELRHFKARTLNVQGGGFLYFDGSDPVGKKLFYSLTPKADSGVIDTGPVAIPLRNIVVERLAQVPKRWPREMVPRDVEYRATAEGLDGAALRLEGAILDQWIDIFGGEHRVNLEVDNAGAIARMLSGGKAGGDTLDLDVHVDGPVLAPRVIVDLAGLEVDVEVGAAEPLDLHLEHATAAFDLATDAGYLEDTVATGAGGEVHLSASFSLRPTSFDLHIDIPKPLNLGPFLPAPVPRLIGDRLSGQIHAFGNNQMQRLEKLDLRMGRAQLSGQAFRSSEGLIHAEHIDVHLGDTHLRNIRGSIDVADKKLDLDFAIESSDLAHWLRVLDAPAVARGLSGTVHIGGSLGNPSAHGSLVATGVPVVGRVEADVSYADQVLAVREAQSSAFGGWLRGSGKLALGKVMRLLDFEAQGVNLQLAQLPGVGQFLDGEVDLSAEIDGPVHRPHGKFIADVSDLSVGGDRFKDTRITASTEEDGSHRLAMTLERLLGGSLHVDAFLSDDDSLGGALTLRDLPVDNLVAYGQSGAPTTGGTVNAEIQLNGTLGAPTLDGTVSALRVWFRESFLGSARLDIDRAGPGVVAISADIFQNSVSLEGTLATSPPFYADLHVNLRRVEIDRLFPQLSELYSARGWLSGELHYRGALMPGAGDEPEVTAYLSRMVISVQSEDADGRPAPIRIRNETPVGLALEGGRIVLKNKVILLGPTGRFTASGSAGTDRLDLGLSGTVDVALLAPYFRGKFESMRGKLDVNARLIGRPGAPRLTGVLAIEDVHLQPAGQEAFVAVPAGKIDFTNEQLSVTGLSMQVVDAFSKESSELTISGGVKLAEFTPVSWGLQIDGNLSGKMLLVVAPQLFSAASGTADLSFALGGTGLTPEIYGDIEFDADNPLTLVPRGTGREISLVGGAIRVSDDLVEIEDIKGWVDDEGYISRVAGEVTLDHWQFVDAEIQLSARDLSLRVPNRVELSVNLNDLEILGGKDHLELRGELEVTDGRYVERFNPFLNALRPVRTAESSQPFYEGVPLLANADLDLTLVARTFFVKNNVADIQLSGEVEVTGTPARPRFAGVIRVDHGSFKFQGIRSRFERTAGTVTFSPYKRFPDDTPVLDLQSESDYTDAGGQPHLVMLSLQGPYGNLNWDLWTQAGLNKGQTLTLILFSRSPEETRRILGDEPVTGRSSGFEGRRSTSGSEGGFEAADQLVKDMAGDFFSLLLEDRLRDITQLDVVRCQLGTASVGCRGEKHITRSVNLKGEAERTLQGSHWSLSSGYRMSDSVTLDGEVLRKNYDDDAERDESNKRVKLNIRFVIP